VNGSDDVYVGRKGRIERAAGSLFEGLRFPALGADRPTMAVKVRASTCGFANLRAGASVRCPEPGLDFRTYVRSGDSDDRPP